jgi:NAD(P)-dependent dehydrogenase (short-subunit alcohol dehydrogenase family)
MRDLRDQAVLVTGATSGIGLATALSFARRGATTYVTCRWGSVDEREVMAHFDAVDARRPVILEADATNADDIRATVDRIACDHDAIDTFVSNVALAQLVAGLDEYTFKGLSQSIAYSAWPLPAHLRAIEERFGNLPKYAVAVSSCGAAQYHGSYAFAGAAKAVLETLVRYLAERFRERDCRINAVRPRWVDTPSLSATIGEDFVPFVRRYDQGSSGSLLQTPSEVADVVLALCSGWLDGMRGQVLTVDHGSGFSDNLMRLVAHVDQLPDKPDSEEPKACPETTSSKPS